MYIYVDSTSMRFQKIIILKMIFYMFNVYTQPTKPTNIEVAKNWTTNKNVENISKRDHCQWLHSQFIVAFHCVCVCVSFHSILVHGIKGGICDKRRYRWNLWLPFSISKIPIPIPIPISHHVYLSSLSKSGSGKRVGMWNRLMSQFVLFSCSKHVVWEQIALWLYDKADI